MSEDLNELRRHLEAITAQGSPADATEDEESAGLRAAWLAFGKLLEESQAEVGASFARPELWQSIAAEADAPSPAKRAESPPSPFRDARRRRKWLLALTSVAAACVLMALAIGRHVGTTKPAAPAAGEKVAAKLPTPPDRLPSQANPRATASHAAQWSWDNSTDQAIGLLGRATIQVEQDELASAAGSSSILDEFDAIGKGVNSNADFSDFSPSTQR